MSAFACWSDQLVVHSPGFERLYDGFRIWLRGRMVEFRREGWRIHVRCVPIPAKPLMEELMVGESRLVIELEIIRALDREAEAKVKLAEATATVERLIRKRKLGYRSR